MKMPHPEIFLLLEREMEIFTEREIEAVNQSPALEYLRQITLEGSLWAVWRKPNYIHFRFSWKSGVHTFLTLKLPATADASTPAADDLGPVS